MYIEEYENVDTDLRVYKVENSINQIMINI